MDSVNRNQPMCDECWEVIFPARRPLRLRHPDIEICAWCGAPNESGIYVRAEPEDVQFPAQRD